MNMDDLKVNRIAINTAATGIGNANDQMKNALQNVFDAITVLDNSWEGGAATNAIAKFHEIRNAMEPNRYTVMNNYKNFLLQQIGEGVFDKTEEENKKLADAFK